MNEALWHRERWAEAVWSSDLTPVERLVALAYADHARDQRTAWVTTARLIERTGLSRASILRAREALITAGWFVLAAKSTPRTAATYLLTTPEVSERDPRGVTETPLSAQDETSEVSESNARGLTQRPNLTTYRTPDPTAGSGDPHQEDDALTRSVRTLGVVPDELLDDVVQRLRADTTTTTTPEARLRSVGAPWVSAHLTAARRARGVRVEAEITAIRTHTGECPHGVPGGAALHPTAGRALCPLCRTRGAARHPAPPPAGDPTDRGLSPTPQAQPHTCDHGWIDRDNARPCLTCKPHLRDRIDRKADR
ncbi:helix-turn-helix domain-containing protein [Cellulomonas endometrii]|uniref:helix-turn-helix domain-containing protein n=1 Tax=Cellulomonas endometrii TaxID=3036301 RepID=UPI0024AD8F66|nr:helix-turn-helix domain-containing protein [Cellulomonas endometrii]